jgi:hypothetical protein
VPSHLQGRIVELSLVAILQIENKRIQRRKGNELIIRIVLLLISPLVVYLVAFGLVKDHSPEIPHIGVSKLVVYLLHEGSVLQTRRIDDLQRIKTLYG